MFFFFLEKREKSIVCENKTQHSRSRDYYGIPLKRCAAAIRRFICARIHIELERERESKKEEI